jgi:hypothetical protein
MFTTTARAEQIAALLHERSELTVNYTGQRMLNSEAIYMCHQSEGGDVIPSIDTTQDQWYQVELRHFILAKVFERKWYAHDQVCAVEA